jgi:hypothetical protein
MLVVVAVFVCVVVAVLVLVCVVVAVTVWELVTVVTTVPVAVAVSVPEMVDVTTPVAEAVAVLVATAVVVCVTTSVTVVTDVFGIVVLAVFVLLVVRVLFVVLVVFVPFSLLAQPQIASRGKTTATTTRLRPARSVLFVLLIAFLHSCFRLNRGGVRAHPSPRDSGSTRQFPNTQGSRLWDLCRSLSMFLTPTFSIWERKKRQCEQVS